MSCSTTCFPINGGIHQSKAYVYQRKWQSENFFGYHRQRFLEWKLPSKGLTVVTETFVHYFLQRQHCVVKKYIFLHVTPHDASSFSSSQNFLLRAHPDSDLADIFSRYIQYSNKYPKHKYHGVTKHIVRFAPKSKTFLVDLIIKKRKSIFSPVVNASFSVKILKFSSWILAKPAWLAVKTSQILDWFTGVVYA